MSLDTASALTKLRSLTAKFDNGVRAATPFYPTVCTIAPSDGFDEEYGFLGNMPTVREWVGDRIFNEIRGAHFTLRNKEWESSLRIEKNRIKDDRMSIYPPMLEQLGSEASYHPDKYWFEIVELAKSSECFDGQFFYDTDHSWGKSGTQSNDLTASAADTSDVTATEFKAAYNAAVLALIQFKRDNGEPFQRPTIEQQTDMLIIVPPALREPAHNAFDAQLINNGETNVVLDRPRIIVSPHLTSSVKFHLFKIGDPLKPFVFQAREPLSRQMKGLDDMEFKDVKFMTEARYNVGYLAWWNAVLTTFV